MSQSALAGGPDLAVVAPHPDASETVRAIRRDRPPLPIVALLEAPSADELVAVLAAGAAAALSATTRPHDLGAVIERVLTDERVIDAVLLERPEIAARVLRDFPEFAVYGGGERSLASVTAREMEILGRRRLRMSPGGYSSAVPAEPSKSCGGQAQLVSY